ncbi:rhamnosyltransferase, partial [Klebsiella grimontii]|nr:rhamnosyltransferase [Klebsiella grimontii]
MNYYIAIPTYNGGNIWKAAVENIQKYAPENLLVHIID